MTGLSREWRCGIALALSEASGLSIGSIMITVRLIAYIFVIHHRAT